jgi:hypothetical protein
MPSVSTYQTWPPSCVQRKYPPLGRKAIPRTSFSPVLSAANPSPPPVVEPLPATRVAVPLVSIFGSGCWSRDR